MPVRARVRHIAALLVLIFCANAQASPIALWKGEDNGDDSIGSNNVTLFNGTGYTDGVVGRALDFGGVADFAEVPGTPAALDVASGDFSVTAWVAFDSLAGDMSIVDKMGGASGNRDGWRLLKQGAANEFWFCLGGGGSNGCTPSAGTTVISNTIATTGQFFHLAAVKSVNTLSLYVDGLLEATSSFSSFTDTDIASLRIGGSLATNGPAYLNGAVDEAAIWDRALSATEIGALANPSAPEPGALALLALGLAGTWITRRPRRC